MAWTWLVALFAISLYWTGAPLWVITLVAFPLFVAAEWWRLREVARKKAAAEIAKAPQRIAEQRRQMDAAVERARRERAAKRSLSPKAS
jgi:hypothetical protein